MIHDKSISTWINMLWVSNWSRLFTPTASIPSTMCGWSLMQCTSCFCKPPLRKRTSMTTISVRRNKSTHFFACKYSNIQHKPQFLPPRRDWCGVTLITRLFFCFGRRGMTWNDVDQSWAKAAKALQRCSAFKRLGSCFFSKRSRRRRTRCLWWPVERTAQDVASAEKHHKQSQSNQGNLCGKVWEKTGKAESQPWPDSSMTSR